jgi:poly(3-hydroxybutyrate) depolymerase
MRRQWHTPSIQFRDFIITPDGSRIIAVTAYIRRHLEEPKPKPSMSGRPAHDPLNGIEGGAVEEFGYEEMDHGVMVIRIADKHIEQ